MIYSPKRNYIRAFWLADLERRPAQRGWGQPGLRRSPPGLAAAWSDPDSQSFQKSFIKDPNMWYIVYVIYGRCTVYGAGYISSMVYIYIFDMV